MEPDEELRWKRIEVSGLHVASWYQHRHQSYDMVIPLRPTYILCSCAEPLGRKLKATRCDCVTANVFETNHQCKGSK